MGNLTRVRIVAIDKAAIVEWANEAGFLQRSAVPLPAVENRVLDEPEYAYVDRPEMGVPVGARFYAPDESITITGAQIMDALHRRGVWSTEDLALYPNAALSALFEVAHLSLSDLTRRSVWTDVALELGG